MRLATVTIAALLAGCGTLDGQLQNALVTTLCADRAFTLSLYGPVGISSELRAADAAELKRLRGGAACSP